MTDDDFTGAAPRFGSFDNESLLSSRCGNT